MLPLLIPALIGVTGFAIGSTVNAAASAPETVVQDPVAGFTSSIPKPIMYGAAALAGYIIYKKFLR